MLFIVSVNPPFDPYSSNNWQLQTIGGVQTNNLLENGLEQNNNSPQENLKEVAQATSSGEQANESGAQASQEAQGNNAGNENTVQYGFREREDENADNDPNNDGFLDFQNMIPTVQGLFFFEENNYDRKIRKRWTSDFFGLINRWGKIHDFKRFQEFFLFLLIFFLSRVFFSKKK